MQYDRHMEKEKAAEATKTIDAEWKELQMLVSVVKVCYYLVHYLFFLPVFIATCL